MTSEAIVGVDLGGMTVTAGCVENGVLVASDTVPTGRDRPADDIAGTISALVRKISCGRSPVALGVGVPVPAVPGTDLLVPSRNLPTMGGYPLKTRLEAALLMPVVLDNDARCMAYGEYVAGSLRGCSQGVCLTLGSGLGCGMVIDGKPYRGAHDGAGEIWQIPVGNQKRLEDTVSREGLMRLYDDATGKMAEPVEICRFAERGDSHARAVFKHYGEAVGDVVVMILCMFDPEKIAIGGGIAGAYEFFRDSLLETVERAFGSGYGERVVPALLSEKASVIGAAAIAGDMVGNP